MRIWWEGGYWREGRVFSGGSKQAKVLLVDGIIIGIMAKL